MSVPVEKDLLQALTQEQKSGIIDKLNLLGTYETIKTYESNKFGDNETHSLKLVKLDELNYVMVLDNGFKCNKTHIEYDIPENSNITVISEGTVIDMNWLFNGVNLLSKKPLNILDLSNVDCSQLKELHQAFYALCAEEVNFGDIDFDNLTDVEGIFCNTKINNIISNRYDLNKDFIKLKVKDEDFKGIAITQLMINCHMKINAEITMNYAQFNHKLSSLGIIKIGINKLKLNLNLPYFEHLDHAIEEIEVNELDMSHVNIMPDQIIADTNEGYFVFDNCKIRDKLIVAKTLPLGKKDIEWLKGYHVESGVTEDGIEVVIVDFTKPSEKNTINN